MSVIFHAYDWTECHEYMKKKINNFLKICGTFLVQGTEKIFLLEKNNELVCLLTVVIGDEYIEIYDVTTRPDMRRMGWAMWLLTQVIDYCKKTYGLKRFWLGVDRGNFPAMSLYKKLGFIQTKITNKTPSGKYRNPEFVVFELN